MKIRLRTYFGALTLAAVGLGVVVEWPRIRVAAIPLRPGYYEFKTSLNGETTVNFGSGIRMKMLVRSNRDGEGAVALNPAFGWVGNQQMVLRIDQVGEDSAVYSVRDSRVLVRLKGTIDDHMLRRAYTEAGELFSGGTLYVDLPIVGKLDEGMELRFIRIDERR